MLPCGLGTPGTGRSATPKTPPLKLISIIQGDRGGVDRVRRKRKRDIHHGLDPRQRNSGVTDRGNFNVAPRFREGDG